jgi:SAM-dependent methyltransferase
LANETDWSQFQVGTISLPTFVKRNLIHASLVRAVLGRSRTTVLEIGVGSGAQSALLSRFRRTVTVDNDPRIISAALPNLDRFGRGVEVLRADAFALPFPARTFDVALSQGLFEHFDDEGIAGLLHEQLRVCRSVVFSVPSDRYPRQDVGNERLMPPAEWERIVSSAVDADRYRVRATYYRFDPEAVKYSALAGRRLGSFSVLVTIDPRDSG